MTLKEMKANLAYWQAMVNETEKSQGTKRNDDDKYDFVINDDDKWCNDQQLEEKFCNLEHIPMRPVPKGRPY